MQVSDIITRVKRQFGDEAGAQITDADIIRWINDAQRDLAASNELLQTTAYTDLIAGQDNYYLPPDILTLRNIRIDGRKLESLTNDQAATWTPNTPNQATGTPTHFSQWALKFDLFPIPDRSVKKGIHLYYTRSPIPVAVGSDVPELPLQYHNRIVDYCLAQAHELDDNLDSYKLKMEMFRDGALSVQGLEQVTSDVYPTISVSRRDTGAEDFHYYE